MATTTKPRPLDQERDLNIGRLRLRELRKRPRTQDIVGVITDADLERTIEGASTIKLTLHDPDWALLQSGLFDRDANGELNQLEAFLDGHWYALVQVAPQDDDLVLTFEDRVAFYMRQFDKPKRQRRTKQNTRAEFIHGLVREVNKAHPHAVGWFCPSEHVFQKPLKASVPTQATAEQQVAADHSGGIAAGAYVTVKGQRASEAQRRIGTMILQEADALRAPRAARFALILAAIQESTMGNPAGGSGSSSGTFQVQSFHPGNHRDVRAMTRYFLESGWWHYGGAIKLARQGDSPHVIAQKVEGSAYPGAYQQWYKDAHRWIDAWDGGASYDASTPGATTYEIRPYYFERGSTTHREDSWAAAARLASEVNWRFFVDRGVAVYMSEEELFKQKPAYIVNRKQSEVRSLTFDWDRGKEVAQADLVIAAERWAFGPGVTVDIVGAGPGNGRWLVSSVNRNAYRQDTEVTLKQPTRPKREPAPEVITHQEPAAATDGTGEVMQPSGRWQWPVRGPITGNYHENRGDHLHDGIDIACSRGTPIRACQAGKVVVASGSYGGYGVYVELDHGGGLHSFYGHLQSIKCHKGQNVGKGQIIATSNNTGSSRGDHLHWGASRNGQSRNPQSFM